MKEPICERTTIEWSQTEDVCDACLVAWPCDRWQKWTASKDYRIQELERERQDHAKQIADLRKVASSAQDRLHKLETTMQGIWPALHDLLEGRSGGKVSVSTHTEYQDVTPFGGPPLRVAGLREYHVNYESPTGTTYSDGHAVEWRNDR